jgi:hypothetical protein
MASSTPAAIGIKGVSKVFRKSIDKTWPIDNSRVDAQKIRAHFSDSNLV